MSQKLVPGESRLLLAVEIDCDAYREVGGSGVICTLSASPSLTRAWKDSIRLDWIPTMHYCVSNDASGHDSPGVPVRF